MMLGGGQPIIVLNQNTKRESGKKVQLQNIKAGMMIADVIRTCLGPRSMLKMLMDPMGGIVLTNDGNAILREITVQHPAAKHLIEIARTQDEEVGDGTTSVVILAGTMLGVAEQFLEQRMHPVVIIQAYRQALEDAIEILKEKLSIPVDLNDESKTIEVIKSCIGTKFMGQYGDLACSIAIKAVQTVQSEQDGRKDIDIKKWARIEKVPGGTIEECQVLTGVMVNKDVTHPKMRRRIEKPRVILLDCPLEFKKGESQTNVEIADESDFTKMLEMEEEHVKNMCEDLIALRPDLVITEKGVSDLAQHYLVKANITCIRRVRKSDNNRIARACGATIANRTEELKEEDVGKGAGLFEIKKIGDEYFTFITECENPKACTILLRGPSKDILNEVERNLQDALCVARNLSIEPFLVAGGGAVEMAVSRLLREKAKSISGVKQWPYLALVDAFEIIPKTLAQNCGGNIIRILTALRAKHASGETNWGVNGETGQLADMNELKIWEPLVVKLQAYKTAVETSVMLLRIDDIVSGSKKKQDGSGGGGGGPMPEDMGIIPVDLNDESKTIEVIKSCIGTKFMGQYGDLACSIAIKAVQTVQSEQDGRKDIDIKKWARIEKVPGGTIEECQVLTGVMVNKDVTHPKMRRRIEKPRVILLDCPLEFKKGESQTNVEIADESDFTKMLEMEEEHVKNMCEDLIALRPDLVITEKGVSDLAQHYLVKANITCIRRVRKSDNNRIARACGATIANRTEELKEEDVGKGAGLFEIKKIGDEYFTFITECENPKACTILLRGPSKDILNEVERNLQDALCVARNLSIEPFLVAGGGAVEMAVSRLLREKAKSISGVKQWPYLALVDAFEIIPKTLAQNCGGNIIRILTALRAKHASGETNWGVNGETGQLADMNELKIWEPLVVKLQAYKTAVETSVMLLRIDDIVSGSKKKQDGSGGGGGGPMPEDMGM